MWHIVKNQKGYMGALFVVAVAVVIGLMIIGITNKMAALNKTYDKVRAYYDSEVAIEKFSVSLKNAYDKANYLNDLVPDTAGDPSLGDYGCPGKLVTLGQDPANLVKLCWEFEGTDNKLCSQRSRESGGFNNICIDSGNLQVRYQMGDEWEVAVKPQKKTFEEQSQIFKAAVYEFFKEFALPQAHANLDAFRPQLPAMVPTNSIAINTSLRSSPEAPVCTPSATNPYQCLKVSFCVKVSGNCAPEERVVQTYLFAKPAKSTQGW